MESEAHVSLPAAVTINDRSRDNPDTETTGSAGTTTVITRVARNSQWGLFWGLGAEPTALVNFAFFCKTNFILGLF